MGKSTLSKQQHWMGLQTKRQELTPGTKVLLTKLACLVLSYSPKDLIFKSPKAAFPNLFDTRD